MDNPQALIPETRKRLAMRCRNPIWTEPYRVDLSRYSACHLKWVQRRDLVCESATPIPVRQDIKSRGKLIILGSNLCPEIRESMAIEPRFFIISSSE